MNYRYEPNSTVLLCPFCHAAIDAFQTGIWESVYANKEREEKVAAHLCDRHPIRWRLNRKIRQAMRGRVPMHVAGSGPL